MIKEIFVQQFYPLAQAAGKLFNINPVVVLAQAPSKADGRKADYPKIIIPFLE
jgi:hypothetical protein